MRRMLLIVILVLPFAQSTRAGTCYVGRLDTIGGTTHDWQLTGQALRRVINVPGQGIHAAWMFSATMSGTTFPDRGVRYNYYDFALGGWQYRDPDFMASGMDPLAGQRCGCGNLAADPVTGEAYLVAQLASPSRPAVVKLATGELCEGPAGYQWPVMAVGSNGWPLVLLAGPGGPDGRLYFSRIRTWCQWDPVVGLAEPGYPSYSIAASAVSDRVDACWVETSGRAYARQSTDAGTTWTQEEELEPPPAFGGDTTTACSAAGLFPFLDSQGRLHYVAAVHPVVDSVGLVAPAAVWHWCEANDPRWAEIHRADPESLGAPVGYGAVFCDRPSIGEGSGGQLWVAWEQFDAANSEPGPPALLRAGIWLSGSADNGASWSRAREVTETNTVSHRFPCILDRMVAGSPGDTVALVYLMDSVAGFFTVGQNVASRNPVVCQWLAGGLTGLVEDESPAALVAARAGPTIVRDVLPWDCQPVSSWETGGCTRPVLLDAAGRKVLDLVPGENDVGHLSPGVYFVREEGSRVLGFKGSSGKVLKLE